jgi:Bacterial regulatory proteins, gntR family
VVTAPDITATDPATDIDVAPAAATAAVRGWPLRPLLDASGLTATELARRLGVAGGAVTTAARRGLSDRQADEWAIRPGLHPLLAWGWSWIDDADQALGRPTYVRLAAALRDQIERGELRPGDPLPTGRTLAARWGIGTSAVTKALDELRAEGLITGGARGHASFVAATLTTGPAGCAGCAACGRGIELGDEHYPHRPACTLATRGWCDCDDQTHPECCPECAGGAA